MLLEFVFYFIVFILIFSYPRLKNKDKPTSFYKLLAIPALLGAVMVLLTAIKVYFLYKLFMLIFLIITFLLTYWQFGNRIRQWWK